MTRRPEAAPQRHRGVSAPAHRTRRGRIAAATVASSCLLLGALAPQLGSTATADVRAHHPRTTFKQVNLVSDIPGLAKIDDPAVRNPWGIAFGPTTPLWVNNQFSPGQDCGSPNCIPAPADLITKITLYAGANGVQKITKVPLEVEASSPTGMVFNPTKRFRINQGEGRVPALFLFNETHLNKTGDGPEARITGWSPLAGSPTQHTTTTSTAARKDGVFPNGLALVPGTRHRGARLLVADNGISIYNARFHELNRPGLFRDRRAEKQGMAPYNAMYLGGRVYITYTNFESTHAVSVFSADGRHHKRLATNGPRGRLQAPWGMAIAPRHWGRFGGDLLVGNVNDGTINAFDRHTGRFQGVLKDADGAPLVNPGLWGIAFGNGTIGTPRTLIFAAGIGEAPGGFGDEVYEHGLVGLIRPVRK